MLCGGTFVKHDAIENRIPRPAVQIGAGSRPLLEPLYARRVGVGSAHAIIAVLNRATSERCRSKQQCEHTSQGQKSVTSIHRLFRTTEGVYDIALNEADDA